MWASAHHSHHAATARVSLSAGRHAAPTVLRSTLAPPHAVATASPSTTLAITSVPAVPVMVNSASGRMGHAAAEAVVKAGLTLVPYTVCGDSRAVAIKQIPVEGIPVNVVGESHRAETVSMVKEKYPNMVVVDFTLPGLVNDNAKFYIEHGLPFVMGTTGGDKERMVRDVLAAEDSYAVIAPQMGKQVVAFQSMLEHAAAAFPGAFKGYKLQVIESHQSAKVDVSGTARQVVESFRQLGVQPFDDIEIECVRNADVAVERMGVPPGAVNGHAFHTYRLTSPDGTVAFQFTHNVVGRESYADGVVDAALFLGEQVRMGAEQQVFSMSDVLKAGVLRPVRN